MTGKAVLTTDNGFGFTRTGLNTFALTWVGSNGHGQEDDVVVAQPAAFNDSGKETLLQNYGDTENPVYTADGGLTYTEHNTPRPTGYGFPRAPGKEGAYNWCVDETGIVWISARETAAPNHFHFFKSTTPEAVAWTFAFDATSVFGSDVSYNVYISGGYVWWLDEANTLLHRCDVDGSNHQSYAITVPTSDYVASLSLSADDIEVEQVGPELFTSQDIPIEWSLDSQTNFPFTAGGDIVIPRTGTWHIVLEANVTWTHGDASDAPLLCTHTAQEFFINGKSHGGLFTFDRWAEWDPILFDAHNYLSPPGQVWGGSGLGNDDASFPALSVSIGDFASDASSTSIESNTRGGRGCTAALGTGAALVDGRIDITTLCGGVLWFNRFTTINDGADGNYHAVFFTGLHVTITWVPPTPSLNGYTLNGWHGSDRLVSWKFGDSKPTLSIDISNPDGPTFIWSTDAPFAPCQAVYDVSPVTNTTLVANTIDDTRYTITGSNPDRHKEGSIYQSTDSGATWTEIVAPTVNLGDTIQENFISCIAPDPTDTAHVCVAIKPPKMYRSTNGGSSYIEETVDLSPCGADTPVEWCGISIVGLDLFPGLQRKAEGIPTQWFKTVFP